MARRTQMGLVLEGRHCENSLGAASFTVHDSSLYVGRLRPARDGTVCTHAHRLFHDPDRRREEINRAAFFLFLNLPRYHLRVVGMSV